MHVPAINSVESHVSSMSGVLPGSRGEGVLPLRTRWCGLLDVRYALIATKFCIAAKCRDVPEAEARSHSIIKSALPSSVAGNSMPSDLAVLRFRASS